MTRRLRLAMWLAAFVLAPQLTGAHGAADEVSVPSQLQVELLGRVVRFERGFAGHAGTPARVTIVVRPGNVESSRFAAQLGAQLGHTADLAGRTVEVATVEYASAGALATAVRGDGTAIVYLSAGLGGEVSGIASALAGRGVLVVSAVGADVDRGAVLGFELVSSRPRIIVNVPRAREQHLDFNANLLRLARVVE